MRNVKGKIRVFDGITDLVQRLINGLGKGITNV